ncbi:UNVERIFIED_CONTAM: hypothetical protein RMT77_017535 [Armadillidium vulgare]
MDNITACEICFHDYNNSEHTPLVLGCGHTFCSPCIKTFKNPNCPKCRTGFKRKTTFPVNYLILSLLEECRAITNLNEEMENRIQNLSEKLQSRLTFIQKEMTEISVNQKRIEEDLNILKSIEDNYKKEDFSKSKLKQELNELETRYKEISLTNLTYFEDPELIASFSVRKMKTKDDFLQQIYKTLKTEKVISFKCIEKKLKVGELSIRDNKLIIHSLTTNDFPKDSKTVPFDHLKEAIRGTDFHVFIIVSGRNETSHLVIIKLQDPKLVPNLIKLCTGEVGPSFKNCIFKTVQDSVPAFHAGEDSTEYSHPESKRRPNWCNIDRPGLTHEDLQECRGWFYNDYRHNLRRQFVTAVELSKAKKDKEKTNIVLSGIGVEVHEDLFTDYYKNIPSEVHCDKNDIVLTQNSNDGFNLMMVSTAQNYEILGKVIEPSKIWDDIKDVNQKGLSSLNSTEYKILDCGIVYEL